MRSLEEALRAELSKFTGKPVDDLTRQGVINVTLKVCKYQAIVEESKRAEIAALLSSKPQVYVKDDVEAHSFSIVKEGE